MTSNWLPSSQSSFSISSTKSISSSYSSLGTYLLGFLICCIYVLAELVAFSYSIDTFVWALSIVKHSLSLTPPPLLLCPPKVDTDVIHMIYAPLCFCILQVIKHWTVGVPGNEVKKFPLSTSMRKRGRGYAIWLQHTDENVVLSWSAFGVAPSIEYSVKMSD